MYCSSLVLNCSSLILNCNSTAFICPSFQYYLSLFSHSPLLSEIHWPCHWVPELFMNIVILCICVVLLSLSHVLDQLPPILWNFLLSSYSSSLFSPFLDFCLDLDLIVYSILKSIFFLDRYIKFFDINLCFR